MVHDAQMSLDEISREDPVVRHLARTIRDGRGMSLADAVREISDLMPDQPERVETAVRKIQDLAQSIQNAEVPRAVVGPGIEGWYPGPRAEDKNWPALVEVLRDEGWDQETLHHLDQASTKVVAYLKDPHAQEFHTRGLVLGYVQSGKTTNFTAVIAKAADAGYRLFIVLSGIHNALRQQTQDRLNEQLWENHRSLWHPLTGEKDFFATQNVDALLSTSDQRVLAVVKKNGTVLRRLRGWLLGARPEILATCPILIIDDEADQASVNTARPDRQPSRINALVRDIVNGAPKAAYVGYTATPFANVLIDAKEYADLYPRDFIVDLPRPSFYIGPEAIFGRDPLEFDPDGAPDDGHDFVRSIPLEELDDLRPQGAAKRHEFEPRITDSLDDALRYFLLSTAARRVRKQGNKHATALVHSSQHIDVHERTAEAISAHLRGLASRLSRGDQGLLESLRTLWEEECDLVPGSDFGLEAVSWQDVAAALPAVAHDVRVIVDNSRSLERLQFDDDHPQVTVAVGGNTLSRGLTLEGLAVSFFVRTASAYDTLLQMGRWFGYRNGYADLTRIWMTDEMREWFHHLATVEEEIRFDIERYETEHLTPEQMGPRIRTHPKLAITAASKMQHARAADVSYSGRRLQTILFNHKDEAWLEGNIAAGRNLLRSVSGAAVRDVREGIQVIGPVDSRAVLDFLGDYSFHDNSRDLDRELITQYVLGRREDGELTHFHIAVMGHPRATDLCTMDLGEHFRPNCINRARLKVVGGSTYADIKSLMSAHDRVIDLPVEPAELGRMSTAELARLRNLPARGGRGDGSGLLLLYPVSKDSRPRLASTKTREPLEALEHVLGVGIVFPETHSHDADVSYVTSNVAALPSDVEAPDDSEIDDED